VILLMHIDNDQRQDHFLRVDLINGAKTFDEMRRWIDARSRLTDAREGVPRKTRNPIVSGRLPYQ